MKFSSSLLVAIVFTFGLPTLGPVIAASPGISILHRFHQPKTFHDGEFPLSKLVRGADGDYYGTTVAGGSQNEGTIFKINLANGHLAILHSFSDGSVPSDGVNPAAALVLANDGNFYGTTRSGGSQGLGTIFKMTPAGVVTILHHFDDGTVFDDGLQPTTELVQGPNGNLYGTTPSGGGKNAGTAYQITLEGELSVLHEFGDDGSMPAAALVLGQDGNFYGTTSAGGISGAGTIFRMTPAGAVTTLARFNPGLFGKNPTAALVQGSDGNFYGTALSRLPNSSIIFKVDSSGRVTSLHTFAIADAPNELVQGSDGNFYGTTRTGGASGTGTAFRMTPAGTVTVLHTFPDSSTVNDGESPNGALIQAGDGKFYGTCAGSYPKNIGTVFKMTPAGQVTVLHRFQAPLVPNDGATPVAGLVQAHADKSGVEGTIYGTTSAGGASGGGTAYKITRSGQVTILHSFGNGTVPADGIVPNELIVGRNGNLYGTTSLGGTANAGTVFKMTPAGQVTILHSFGTVPHDGTTPFASVIEGRDSNFYGTTSSGGTAGRGTVFRMTPAGVVTILHNFLGVKYDVYGQGNIVEFDGASPAAQLVEGGAGNFYGTTYYGGGTNKGTVFKVTSGGVLSLLHSFGDGSVPADGVFPSGRLIPGGDGFYGTTSVGGYLNGCTLFTISEGGHLSVLYGFRDAFLESGVIRLINGNLAGIIGGNSQGRAVLFEYSTTTHMIRLVSTFGGFPAGQLLETSDGTILGTSQQGGVMNLGTVFQFTKAPQTISFPNVGKRAVGGTFLFPVTASSGLPVTLSIVSGNATASGRTITLGVMPPAPVVVEARQVGDAYFAPVTARISFTPLVTQTITFGPISSKKVGTTYVLGARATSNLAITYTAQGPVTIANGSATVTGTGTISIRAHQYGNTQFAPAPSVLQTFEGIP